MFRLRASFQLNTPAFVGGTSAADEAELRIEPIVGQLRRWWWARAPIRPNFFNDQGAFQLRSAQECAGLIFGSSEENDAGRKQGKFLIKIAHSTCESVKKATVFQDQNIEHLFGPLWSDRKHVLWSTKDDEHPIFELDFFCSPANDDPRLVDELVSSLCLWGLLGGIGSGARRGFGSVQLLQLTGPNINVKCPETESEYRAMILRVLGLADGNVRPLPNTLHDQSFGAFTQGSVISAAVRAVAIPDAKNGIESLSWIARALKTNKHAPRGARAISVFSQPANSGRVPSPYHQHVGLIASQPFYLSTTLVTKGWDDISASNLKEFIEGPHGFLSEQLRTENWLS